jgi:hypothetical protein
MTPGEVTGGNPRWPALVAIGALALAGAFGAMRAGRMSCPPGALPSGFGAPTVPIDRPSDARTPDLDPPPSPPGPGAGGFAPGRLEG